MLQSVPRPSHISPHFRYGDAAPSRLRPRRLAVRVEARCRRGLAPVEFP